MFNFKLVNVLFLTLLMLSLVACSSESTSNNEGESEEITIRLGHAGNGLESDPYNTYSEKLSEVLEEESDGRIKLQVFPNSQLGNLDSMKDQVNNGNLEMTAGQNTGTLATYNPNIQVLDLPYAFETLEVGQAVLNGDFGQKLKDGIADSSNMKLMSFIPSSFRNFGNNKHPITSPDDLKGLTIRVMEVPVHQEMVKALGATPQVIAFEELYSALQTGVVDGHEQAPYTMLMVKLQEVTKYFTLDKHVMNTAVSLINKNFFDNLSEADQQIVIKAEAAATQALLDHVTENTEKDMQTILDAGVEVTELTPEQFKAFQDVVIGQVSEYLESKIDEGLVDEMLQAIDEAK
ncbi:TRAP transporter substrate-binding protein [Pseudalkalibacillus sp. A8]|uniref:TRAP transporter substrate-binding protein n=1 Tax=Pseudalkalibacillus sp. A8 TaxID=3382641 RepID=UPI0038B4AB86